jgi:hypothetical protein
MGYLYYRFYSLYHSMGIRLYRRWLAVISMTVTTGIQALSLDTLLNSYFGTTEFFDSYYILLVFITLMFLIGFFLFMSSERHFRIMNQYRGETSKSEKRGYLTLIVYLLTTAVLLILAGNSLPDI